MAVEEVLAMDKEVKQLLKTIEHIQGVEVRATNKSHIGVYKDGKIVTTIPTTPSDHRWRDNAVRNLRAAGITPSVHPVKPVKAPARVYTIEELRKRVTALSPRSDFCRFIVHDMPKLHPKMRTYKNYDSAVSSMNDFVHEGLGLSPWAHLLLNQAFRDWDALQAQVARVEEVRAEREAENEPGEVIIEQEVMEALAEELPIEPVANGLRSQYTSVLLEILRNEGSYVDDKILERLDRMAGS
jgi:hypothetical protein